MEEKGGSATFFSSTPMCSTGSARAWEGWSGTSRWGQGEEQLGGAGTAVERKERGEGLARVRFS